MSPCKLGVLKKIKVSLIMAIKVTAVVVARGWQITFLRRWCTSRTMDNPFAFDKCKPRNDKTCIKTAANIDF